MTERPRPKPRHKKLSNKRQSVPNHLTNRSKRKKDFELKRPRPSLTLKRGNHSNPTKPINLIQSISNESFQPLYDQDDEEERKERSSSTNASKKEELLQKLQKLDNITKNQSSRKARNDLDEIKQFINDRDINNPSIPKGANSFTKDDETYKQLTHTLNKTGGIKSKRDTLPTSLKLIGIRDPKSLLYHRQFKMNNFGLNNYNDNNDRDNGIHNNHNHHRAQSSMLVTTTNNNRVLTKQPSIINKGKYSHLRSFSSIMGPSNQQIKQSQNVQNASVISTFQVSSTTTKQESTTEYVQGVKSRKPSQIFGVNSMSPNTSKPSQITTTLQQLADEYYDSDDSDDDDDDDDIKDDK